MPAPAFPARYYYLKIRERSSYAYALVSVAAGLSVENDRIGKVGLAMGGVAHKPWRLTEAETFLTGKVPNEENFAEAGVIAMRDARPLTHNGYKLPMGERAVARALSQAYNRTA